MIWDVAESDVLVVTGAAEARTLLLEVTARLNSQLHHQEEDFSLVQGQSLSSSSFIPPPPLKKKKKKMWWIRLTNCTWTVINCVCLWTTGISRSSSSRFLFTRTYLALTHIHTFLWRKYYVCLTYLFHTTFSHLMKSLIIIWTVRNIQANIPLNMLLQLHLYFSGLQQVSTGVQNLTQSLTTHLQQYSRPPGKLPDRCTYIYVSRYLRFPLRFWHTIPLL